MTHTRKRLGDFGEHAVCKYLTRQGYIAIAKKWRCLIGEIDLVMRDGEMIVFVEVRTQRGHGVERAAESVGRAKQQRLATLAYCYLEANDLAEETPWRIDVVMVQVDSGGRIGRIEQIRDAVQEL